MLLCQFIASPNTPLKKLLNFVIFFLPSHFRITLLLVDFQSTSIYGIFFFYTCPTSILPSVSIHVFATSKWICIDNNILAAITKINYTLSEVITGADQFCYHLTLAGYSERLI